MSAKAALTVTHEHEIVVVHTMPDLIVVEIPGQGELELNSDQAEQLTALLAAAHTNSRLIEWVDEDADDDLRLRYKASGEPFEA